MFDLLEGNKERVITKFPSMAISRSSHAEVLRRSSFGIAVVGTWRRRREERKRRRVGTAGETVSPEERKIGSWGLGFKGTKSGRNIV